MSAMIEKSKTIP